MSAPAACAVAAVVADLLDVDGAEVDEHADLIECGLDSLAMMRLAARWRSEGYDVSFAQLVSEPTVAAWRRLRGPAAQTPRPARADDGIDTRPFELALMQHAYWVGRNGVRELGGVAAHFYNEFDGAGVDPGRLDAAVRSVVRRHGMLRVRVADDGTQRIAAEPVRSGPRVHDLRAMDAAAATAELGRIRDELSHRILDVSAGEVFDVQLSLLPDALRPAGTRVHVNLDMIAADAVSLRILLGDLAAAYDGTALTDIGYSYPRYLRDRRRDPDPERDAARSYWTERLPRLPPAPVLPAATDGTVEATTVLRRHRLLSAAELRSFESHARARGLTPAMALATAFAETLTCFSAGPRFLLNLPLFDREPLHPGVADLVGDFTSSVLLAWDGAEPGGFAERATAFQRRFHADVAHSRFSGVEVLRELSRLHGERVLAPVVYTSALGMGDLFAAEVRERFGDAAWIVSQGPQVWLDAQVTEIDGGLLVNWDAREHAFAPGVLDAMFDGYRGLLDRLVAGPEQWDRPVPAMLPADQRAVRERVNATDVRRHPRTLHHAFFRRAAEQPDRPALLWADGRTTVLRYGELAGRALAGAADLERSGVRPGDLVGISLPKGPEQAVAALAVLAAGGVYVPIGIGQPAERVARIRTVSGVRHVVTDPLGCGDGLAGPVDVDPGDLAYVLHTSGSTGEPKGVEITHAAATNTLDDLLTRFSVGADDRTIMLSELDFDLSVFDLFAPLAVGGAVVCVEEEHRRDAAEWVRLVERHSVTVVNAAPALVDMLLTAAGTRRLGLRTVITGGDVVGIDLPTRVRAVAPLCRFAGLGGTTETAIHSTVCEVADVPRGWTAVPYGTPLDNVRCRVVDALGRDRPDEVPGELWIGGAGVARSYRGRPELTAERFREHRGTRYYATGDVARYRPDGTLEFLGRADHQVKVRGHRIELGEVEAAFTAQPAVASAVACLFRGRSLGVLVTAACSAVDTEAVRRCAADRLPAAMRPETVASVDALPLTVNGKIDRGAVAALLDDRATADVAPAEPPRTPVETVVATAWSDLLGVAEVGRDHDFFALGGDSLLATRLVGRLRADGIDGVALSTLFARPVLAEFCATLRRGTAAERTEVVPDPGGAHEPFPLTDVQRAYWLGRSPGFTLGGVGCHFHREYEVADLDVPRLEAAVDRLVRRHPMLRAVVDPDGTQRVLAEVPAFRVRVVSAEDDVAEDEWRRTASHRTFEPGQWPLFAVDAVSRGGRVLRLGVGVDNLVLDALSILVLYGELAALYEDPAAELPPVDLTFRDYVSQVRPDTDAVAQAERYWLDRLDALPSAPALPLAVDPERIGSPRFVRYEALVPAAAWRALGERARHHQVTPSAVLVSAYAEVLARWSGQPDLTLTVTLFDRREDVHPHVHRVLGDFTSLALLPHRSRVGATLLDTVRAVQQELGRVLDHRAVSATWVLRELARRRAEPDLTMPVVFTSALGVPGGTAAPAVGPFARPVRGISQTPQVWLDHQVTEVDGGVQVNWDVVEGLFPAGMVEEMFAAYVRLLSAAADRDWALPVPDPLPVEQAAVRAGVNAVAAPELTDRLLHGPFFTGAAHEPARTAVVVPGGPDLSHGELAERALRLAALLAGRGVGAGDTVAVRLPKGPDQVTAVLGVLASGAAYVPIGVDQPPARAAAISDRAGAREVVTAELLALAAELEPLAHPVQVSGDATAYVIFTSGSTGEPKGVEITHEAARNTVADVCARFGVGPDDRVLAVSALDFDLSVFDVFGPLAVGGALVTVAEDERRDARAWVRHVHEHGVTVWNTVPALVDMLLMAGAGSPDALASLRVVLTSGDWVGVDLPGRLRAQAPACRFVAMGGATEAAIWSNWFEVAPGDEPDPSWRSVPYGHPLGGQEFRVVDAHGRDCPDWVTGELWIGGAGVALGYRGDPEGTAARFVTVGGRRWYRTGDLGRYRPGGTLEFLGRVDQQVKVRGHRIELGEIETALLDCAGVGAAVAAVAGTGSTARLVAAIVPELPSQRPGPDVAPGPDPGPSAAVAVARDRDRETESRVVERALCAVLGLGGAGSGPTTVDAIGVAPAHRAVLELWLDWLVARGAVTREGHRIGPPTAPRRPVDLNDSAYQRLLADAGHRLSERAADLRAILSGAAEPSSLLDDPVLAPAALAAADPAAEIAVAEVAARIRALSGRLGRPARVLEIDGRAGGTAVRLLAGLSVTDVDYTLMDESSAMIAAARERLAHGPHEVRFAVSTGERVLGPLLHSFDAVLADNVLHRAADPARGTLVAAALLAPGGELLVVEREELTPLAMVTAGLLEGGFAGLDPRRRAACSPMLTGAQWARELVNCGFVDVAQHTLGASFSCFVRAVRPASAATIDLEAVRAALARRLPPHMVPDRLGVVPVPPLSANGKVDRAAVADLLPAETATTEDDEPHEGLESEIAVLWRELLDLPAIGRGQSFFALGGDSLLANRFLTAASGRLGVDIPLRVLFAGPTLAEVAAAAGAARAGVEEGEL